MAERAIVALLKAAGTLAGDRIRPLELDRETVLPAITYQRISTPRTIQHDGEQGYTDFRTYVNCWTRRTEDGSGYAQARALADQVRRVLNGFSGSAGGVTVGMMRVTGDRDEQDTERRFERVLLEVAGNTIESKLPFVATTNGT